MKILDDTVFYALETRGYAIVHGFLPEAQRATMAAALRRILKPWDEIKDDAPPDRMANCHFPYSEQCLNRAIVNREAIAFAQRWLGTDAIHYRPGLGMVTYPGRKGGPFHMDNGNNTLLPPTESDRHHSQLNFWFCLEDVGVDQAPTLFVAAENGHHQDTALAEPMVAPGGSVAYFSQLFLARRQRLSAPRQPALYMEICLWARRSLLGGSRALHPRWARLSFLRIHSRSLRS